MLIDANASVAYVGALPVAVVKITGASSISSSPFLSLPGVESISGPKGSRVSRPKIHRDDYELCWVLSGALEITLPSERHELAAGQSLQFDALLEHTYLALEDCELLILHIRKEKRF